MSNKDSNPLIVKRYKASYWELEEENTWTEQGEFLSTDTGFRYVSDGNYGDKGWFPKDIIKDVVGSHEPMRLEFIGETIVDSDVIGEYLTDDMKYNNCEYVMI